MIQKMGVLLICSILFLGEILSAAEEGSNRRLTVHGEVGVLDETVKDADFKKTKFFLRKKGDKGVLYRNENGKVRLRRSRDKEDVLQFIGAEGNSVKEIKGGEGYFDRTFKGKSGRFGGYQEIKVPESGKGVLVVRSISETETSGRTEAEFYDEQGNKLWEKEPESGWNYEIDNSVAADDGNTVLLSEIYGNPLNPEKRQVRIINRNGAQVAILSKSSLHSPVFFDKGRKISFQDGSLERHEIYSGQGVYVGEIQGSPLFSSAATYFVREANSKVMKVFSSFGTLSGTIKDNGEYRINFSENGEFAVIVLTRRDDASKTEKYSIYELMRMVDMKQGKVLYEKDMAGMGEWEVVSSGPQGYKSASLKVSKKGHVFLPVTRKSPRLSSSHIFILSRQGEVVYRIPIAEGQELGSVGEAE